MRKLALVILLIFIINVSNAAPITNFPPTEIGSNNVTLQGLYGVGPAFGTPVWFEWGQLSKNLSWKSPNGTYDGSLQFTRTIKGSPLNGNTLYYYRACDANGCGNEHAFTTASVTPMPTTTLGYIFENLTETQFDIMFIPKNIIAPYSDWIEPTGQENNGLILSIVFGVLFFAIFAGMWMSGRSTFVPGMVGLIASGLLWGTGGAGGLGILIAPEFVAVAQGIMVASFAGVIMGMIKR